MIWCRLDELSEYLLSLLGLLFLLALFYEFVILVARYIKLDYESLSSFSKAKRQS